MASTFEKYMDAVRHFEMVEQKFSRYGAGDSEGRTGLQDYLRGNKRPYFGLYEQYEDTPIGNKAQRELEEACEKILVQVKKNTKKVAEHLK